MKRLLTLIAIGFAGLLAGCGSSVSSSTQPGSSGGLVDVYSVNESPDQFTLNAGDWASITATVDLSQNNSTPKPLAPQPVVTFYSSDPRVTVSPAGEVCAGLWDVRYLTCTATVTPSGQPDLPTGYVIITAYNASHNVFGTTQLSVHERAARITLSAPVFTGAKPPSGVFQIPAGQYPSATQCVSQGNLVQYTAAAVAASNNPIPSCSIPVITSYPLTSISEIGGVVTATFSYTGTAPSLAIGKVGTISGVTPSSYNGSFTLTSVVIDTSAMTVTVKMQNSSASGSASGGEISISSLAPGCTYNNDYTWSADNSSAAQVSSYGSVIARNPGLTNIYATLNGTVSAPLAFVTCPPQSIVLSTSTFFNAAPTGPFTTADLTGLNKGGRAYVTATMTDTNGLPLITSPLTFITTDPLIGSFTNTLPLTSTLTANTSGRFTMMASCGPASCNAAVESFISPAGPGTGQATGFGFPIYSNVIGTTVQGTTGSTVLVTGTLLSDGVTSAHRLLIYDSESLSLIQIVSLANVPNSLVVAPNGATAYVGSSGGLIVVNLSTNPPTPTLRAFPIAGGLSTDVITGTVLGVSPDSRYVVLSDTSDPNPANHLVFFIDTTGTKIAQRYSIPSITSVAFAPDDSNIWIGGAAGVYQFEADTFVPISAINPLDAGLSTNVNSLAWMPDGQSFFASGDQLINYSTCNDRENLPTPPGNYTSTVTNGLSTTALPSVPPLPGAVPHLLGLDGNEWFDYSVTSSSEVPNQTVPTVSALIAGGPGNVCNSTVSVNTPVTAPSTLLSTAQQITFSPTREQEYVTGVKASGATPESLIHGYDVLGQTEIKIPTLASYGAIVPLSGGVLTDGRKLYFSTYDGTPNGTLLHRIDLATQTEDFVQQEVLNPATGLPANPPTFVTVVPATVGVVPSFVAVVPK